MRKNTYGTDPDTKKRMEQLKVLIVDDQPEVRSLIRDVLAETGVHQVFEAANGKEAMQFVDADFDIVNMIICDWNMPGMSGVEFLQQIRTVFPEMPFLMITGRCDKNSVMHAKMAGVTAFIKKPFSPDELECKLKVLSRSP